MRYYVLILSLLVTLMPHLASAEGNLYTNIQPGGVITAAIDSPSAGQAVQGAVVIRGSSAVDGFQSYEIDFAPATDPTQTWSLIKSSTEPIQDGILAVWDTNSISDGDYNLRLLISKVDGSQSLVTVTDVRVRNYTLMDRGVPTPTIMYVTLGPGTPTSTPIPQDTQTPSMTPLPSTPTPLPPNPAEVTGSQVMSTLGKGAAISIALLLILGVYVGLRTFLNGRK
jgi:hypothetical protein